MDRASRRTARTPGARAAPPPYGFFTVPRFALWPAAEALLGLLFANLFWVGLWDLLDSTIFPSDGPYAMLTLVVLGIIGMYVTNALYDSEPDKADAQGAAPQGGAATPRGAASYGATDSHGATQTVSPAVQMLSAADLAAARKSPALTLEQLVDQLEVDDQPCVPPRFEPWRLCERIVANCAAVFVWVGVWDQIDMNVLPLQCSYNACGRCSKYGQFPCAWYKIGFIIFGVVGQYFTRNLYVDSEVTYVPRRQCPCCGGRLRRAQSVGQQQGDGL